MTPASAIYEGTVYHRRLKPVGHAFRYRVFSMLFDLSELSGLDASLRWFSRNRFNLFSFHDRDHGDGGADIEAGVRRMLQEAGVKADGRILLLCYPRILGYVFNPLSVFYCHDADGALAAIIYEVRNTFGGKHAYLIPCGRDEGAVIRQEADKVFHVSPFIPMAMRYHFAMTPPRERVSVSIRETDAEGPLLDAVFTGARAGLDDAALLRAFFAYPLMTLKVVAAIHFEAARLMLKGAKLLKGAPDPDAPTTVIRIQSKKTRDAA